MRTLVATILALAFVLSAAPATAREATGSYAVASTPVISVVCSPNCLGVEGANIGGYRFGALANEVPTSVSIDDASGGNVPFTVCQDLNLDSLCGNTDPTIGPLEPRVVGCGKDATLTGFAPGVITSVFVRALDASCAGGATSGTITMTFV